MLVQRQWSGKVLLIFSTQFVASFYHYSIRMKFVRKSVKKVIVSEETGMDQGSRTLSLIINPTGIFALMPRG